MQRSVGCSDILNSSIGDARLPFFCFLRGTLGSSSCPAAPMPEDEGMKKWLSFPENIRKPIVKYSSDFHGNALQGNIGYLYVPAMEAYDPGSINEKVTRGRKALANAKINKSCGLIVDLRFNTGGSLQPMLLTLGGIIPSGQLFSLGKDSPIYLSRNGNMLSITAAQELYGQYSGRLPSNDRNKPIAILINWMTGSSGEMTGLALRDNVVQAKIFGEPSSPTASVNQTFYLLDGNTFNLMVDRVYNKKGKMVSLALPVDKQINDSLQTVFNPDKDETLRAAREWLESLPICKYSS